MPSESPEGSDAEVDNPLTYNRDEIITSLTEFYEFLSTLPYVEPAAVLTPPSAGWPNITPENFAGLHKNDEVINLLKHLPYIDLSHHEYIIAPETYPVDYRGELFQRDVTVESVGRSLPLGDDVAFPEWVINLTYGSRDGTYVMLDTSDGTVTEYNIQYENDDPQYDEDDPRSWRNQCEGEAMSLTELLDDWRSKYFKLEWMGHSMNGWPTVMWADRGDENYEDVKEMRKIIRKHGWPSSFQREACQRALREWDQSKV
ncbi:hypothetical protein BCR34DRAFT_565883 [Clohesyomyces aquaticus]|uniref:Uncharacterized protein n=1 Tax=Clohesyomyces aquaticus TaxID=1231657 RepID=A0A1Y1ZLG2_9PLEO|nr:hypothetical protein BCR34DRAFT_565883 [Clohesyomyces aquaticus]